MLDTPGEGPSSGGRADSSSKATEHGGKPVKCAKDAKGRGRVGEEDGRGGKGNDDGKGLDHHDREDGGKPCRRSGEQRSVGSDKVDEWRQDSYIQLAFGAVGESSGLQKDLQTTLKQFKTP